MTPEPNGFRQVAEAIVYDPPDWHSSTDLVDAIETAIRAAVAEAVEGERETCAMLAETFGALGTELDRGDLMGRSIAVAIRARSREEGEG